MDYLDELDDSTMNALAEMGADMGDYTSKHDSAPCPNLNASNIPSTRPRRRRLVEATYLLRLETPLATPHDVANSLKLPRVPQLECGTSEDDDAIFCRLRQSEADTLDEWSESQRPKPKLTKVRLVIAHKSAGELPFLGRDRTLPQF